MALYRNCINTLRIFAAAFSIVVMAFPLSAEDATADTDSVFTFKFLPGNDMFYVPLKGNGEELLRLFDSVDLYKDRITDRSILLRVDGYCVTQGNKGVLPPLAKTRSNRVKSELIIKKGLKEDNFLTRNHPGLRNLVTVRFIPNESLQPKQTEQKVTQEPVSTPQQEAEPVTDYNDWAIGCVDITDDVAPEGEAVIEEVIDEVGPAADVQPTDEQSLRMPKWYDNLALKTNLLPYAILMPNIEAEWKFSKQWSVALEYQIAWWSKNSADKVYRIATVIPEVRYWAISHSKWHGMYVGLFVGGGEYDLDNGKKGHEGEGILGGASIGYMWPIGKHLSLDAGIGVGYMRLRDKSYAPLDGHYLYQLTKNINYFGPLRAKLSLVWRFWSEKTERKK